MSYVRKIIEKNFPNHIDLGNALIKKRFRYELFHPLRRQTISGIATTHYTESMCPPLLIVSRNTRGIGNVSVYFRSFDNKLKYDTCQNMNLFTLNHSFFNPEIEKWDSKEVSTNNPDEIAKNIEEIYK